MHTSTINNLPLWTTQTAVQATNALESSGEWQATGVSIDSRTIKPGELFMALRGPEYDGHNFAHLALNAGAVAVCVMTKPDNLPSNAPYLLVSDVLKALYDLGQARRRAINAQIVAITGSVGKTSTKEILGQVLSLQAPTYISEG